MERTPVDDFILRWSRSGAAERANYQLFLSELCDLLEVPRPDPATPDDAANAYVFERGLTFQHGDGSTSRGFIDLYRRGRFVLEAKQGVEREEGAEPLSEAGRERRARRRAGTATRGTARWDEAMLRARGQAEQYARALPPEEGRPPFLLVVDVGHSIELYSEFTRSGATYVPFPDPRAHRILLDDLRRPEARETLRQVWEDPLALDPGRRSARVTREIAGRLARLARSLEGSGQLPQKVAAFLMRCLFTMFAEDIGLLPKNGFTGLLESLRGEPRHFPHLVGELWQAMNHGGFSAAIRADLLRFNGGLFADPEALPLDADQIGLLIEAGRADWRHVEPAIFGTLLERALDPVERHQLGAHYTPRAYVERLVLPTVVEPLRGQWQAVQTAALTLERQGRADKAVDEVRAFHHRLCHLRVLDPACGSGNFLYVTLEHLKRLEGEVLETLEALGETQTLLDLQGVTVDPHQLLGLELNPRAAAIAEMVLWIGYLQWHFRTRGNVSPPEPVIRDFHNIRRADAVLAWDAVEFAAGDDGRPLTRWDGRTTRTHPVTGARVPDETARVPVEVYVNPRRADWPETDFVVGNPPFIGAGRMRQALGDGYAEALRRAYPEVPESADYVMYWWHRAAGLARAGAIERFGLIATNSLRQTFNRRVLQQHMEASPPLSLAFAVPDHPWVDSADGAAVRISMTVGRAGEGAGSLQTLAAERPGSGEGLEVELERRAGLIRADLSVGADVAGAVALKANGGIAGMGVKLHGAGFIVTEEQARQLGYGRIPGLENHIRPFINGRDLVQATRGVMVIDLFGLDATDVRRRFPEVFQWVLERVKPERDHNNRATYRDNWWIFGEPRRELRPALAVLSRYIATTRTARHRIFQYVDSGTVAESKVVVIALDDSFFLGVLSSRIHVAWALAAGGWLGAGNDPTYNHSDCFYTFPFPDPDPDEPRKARIRALAEELDAHRKARQAEHPDLTLTGLYNVLERLRSGEPLTPKERDIHARGLAGLLLELHQSLDAEVAAAYGWPADLPEAEILERLVDLNRHRAAEERRGRVRWLRPDFQRPRSGAGEGAAAETAQAAPEPAPRARSPWPKSLPEQIQAVRDALAAHPGPAGVEALAAGFARAPRERVAEVLESLADLGHLRRIAPGQYSAPS